MTSSSSCARKISTEWTWKKNSETPCCGYVRKYLGISVALLTGLEKTQNLIIPVKPKSKILILYLALSALQAITFQLEILEKTGLSE